MRIVFFFLSALVFSSCVMVHAYDREAFTDPTMSTADIDQEGRVLRKLHQTREGASGGDGQPAGGGCGCGN